METILTPSRKQVLAFAAALAFSGSALADAGSGSGVPSGVVWSAVIAFVFGFVMGSAPARDSGMDFDGRGGLYAGLSASSIVGGIALALTEMTLTPGLYLVGLGILLALGRWLDRRPLPVPKSIHLAEGVNRASGESLRKRAKSAREMFLGASFQKDQFGRQAIRHLEVNYGSDGALSADLEFIKQDVERASPRTFAILLLHVSTVPGEQDQPGVVVVQGVGSLKKLQIDSGSVTTEDGVTVQASTIISSVRYSWL